MKYYEITFKNKLTRQFDSPIFYVRAESVISAKTLANDLMSNDERGSHYDYRWTCVVEKPDARIR